MFAMLILSCLLFNITEGQSHEDIIHQIKEVHDAVIINKPETVLSCPLI